MTRLFARYFWGSVMLVCTIINTALADQKIIIQSTTSTKNSGLYDYILPLIKDTGVTAHVVAVGTGAAIKNAMNCDGDVLLVHSRKREDKFVAEGYAGKRYNVMYNDYIIVGPRSDWLGIAGLRNAAEAFGRSAKTQSIFVSRGDMSGTHSKESALWQQASVLPETSAVNWYRQTGSGMGAGEYRFWMSYTLTTGLPGHLLAIKLT